MIEKFPASISDPDRSWQQIPHKGSEPFTVGTLAHNSLLMLLLICVDIALIPSQYIAAC